MRNAKMVALVMSAAFLVCCTSNSQPSSVSNAQPVAAGDTAEAKPTSRWYVQAPETNPIDGTKTQILSLRANESTRRHDVNLVLAFANGKLCRSPLLGVRMDVDGFVTVDNSRVRIRFDEENPVRDGWGLSASNNALYPHNQNQFLVQLLHHSKLAIEYSYYEEAPRTVTFDIAGLAHDMKGAGLYDPTEELKAAAQRAKAEAAAQAKVDAANKARDEEYKARWAAAEQARRKALMIKCQPYIGSWGPQVPIDCNEFFSQIRTENENAH